MTLGRLTTLVYAMFVDDARRIGMGLNEAVVAVQGLFAPEPTAEAKARDEQEAEREANRRNEEAMRSLAGDLAGVDLGKGAGMVRKVKAAPA